jgi:hypothetical protein
MKQEFSANFPFVMEVAYWAKTCRIWQSLPELDPTTTRTAVGMDRRMAYG